MKPIKVGIGSPPWVKVGIGFLSEWQLEHRSRGLSSKAKARAHCRFRTAVQCQKKKMMQQQKLSRGCGSAKFDFMVEADSARKAELGRKLTAIERLDGRSEASEKWDNLPESHPDKIRLNAAHEERRTTKRLNSLSVAGRPFPP